MQESAVLPSPVERYRFGVFDFDPNTLELRKNDRAVRVRPQSLTLLRLLVSKPGEVVSRDEIQQALWGQDTFVDFEQGVNHAIRELRSVLGDNADSPRFIQTLARRGYRFVAPVERILPESASHPVAAPAAPSVSHEPQAASGFRRHLVAAGLVLAAVGAAAAVFALRPDRSPLPAPAIAVVPFTSPATDPALGAGLSNAIAVRLGGQQRAVVRSVATSADIGGANLVLSGEVSRDAGVVRVAARLDRVATGEAVWSERFQLRADELHSFENVIAERVSEALNLQLAAAEQERLRRRYTQNAAAYEDYLRGRAALVRYTQEATLGAIDAFESALRRDPEYVLARAGLAMACADMCLRFAKSSEVEHWGQRAEAEARAALDLDPGLAEAHLARAAVARKREFDWGLAIASSRRALVLNPNLDQAHYFIAAALSHSGYMEEALIEVQNGQRLHGPDALDAIRLQGVIALWSGDYAPARARLEEVSRKSDEAIGDTYLALAYYYSGSADQALAMFRSLANSSSASTASRAGAALAAVLAAQKDAEGARREIARVLKREYRDHHVSYQLGTAYAQLGDTEEALRWLRTAADTGFPNLTWFERDPLLDPIRSDSSSAALLEYVRVKRERAV
jgi:DNA-binding winged helix-turn-helix (wHTH) protein/tetratricopeptide (TPR) repeat protein